MPKLQFKNLSITFKFILWFLLIALLPLAIATYISYDSSRKVLKKEVTNSLVAVADYKANQIESYLRDKKEDLVRLSNMPDVIIALEKFDNTLDKNGIESAEYLAVDAEFRSFLTYYQNSFGYEDLFLIRTYGDVVFSAKNKPLRSIYATGPYKDTQLEKIFVKVNLSLQAEISDFEYNPEVKDGYAFIAAPVLRGGETIGVVVAQMGNKGLYTLISDYKGLGRTGEIIIASRMGEEIVWITHTRFNPAAAFSKKTMIDSKDEIDLQRAVRAESGTGVSIDYRGQEVMSVWRHLPTFKLGIVVKMDIKEIFTSAKSLRDVLARVSLALLILVIIMAVIIASSVSRPIKELTKVSSEITGGNLLARVNVNTKDEIGELAHSFNQMTDRLVEAKSNVEQQKEQLEEQKKLLEKVNKELDSFVYTASHDLRAPLRGISSFASFLEEDYTDKLDSKGRDYLKEIKEGTQRMNQLIEDLLTLSRISRIRNPYEDTDINSLIESVVKRIEFDIKNNKVGLKVQENLPTIRCDRIKLTEVFLNLINNAIKFSSKNNKENPRVEVGYMEEGWFHKFYVKDNGIGIDPKYHDQVFGLFKRLHTAKEYEGTGAGLSIVKRVIDDHNGKIWIESEIGKGATFYFTIPKDLKEKKKKIGEILIEEGVISEQQLKETLKKQGSEQWGLPEYKGDLHNSE